MKRIVGLACLLGLLTLGAGLVLLSHSPAPQAAPPCIDCPLAPLPDECPPCTEWVPGTCKKCPHCARIPGCKA